MATFLILIALLLPILIGLVITGSQSGVKLTHKDSSLQGTCYTGFSWNYYLFGWFVPVFRGEIVIGLVHLLFTIFTLGLFQFVMAFLYNKQHAKRLLTSGYELNDSEEVNARARAVFGLAGETDGSKDRWALAMTLSLIISVPALLVAMVIGTAYDVGYFDSDSEDIEASGQQSLGNAEEARRRAEELARGSERTPESDTQARRMAEELARKPTKSPRFENTYMEIERPLVASLVNSTKVMQIKVAIMTHDGDRVISNMKKHESNIRYEMLDVMRNVDESALSAPGFRKNFAEKLKVATNLVLEKYEDFGGVEAVMFTEFEVQ